MRECHGKGRQTHKVRWPRPTMELRSRRRKDGGGTEGVCLYAGVRVRYGTLHRKGRGWEKERRLEALK